MAAPIDSYDFHVWSFDEASGASSFACTGSVGTPLNVLTNSPTCGFLGPYGGALKQNPSAASNARTTNGGTAENPSTTQLSVHGWYYPLAAQGAGAYGRLISKWYTTTFATGYDAFSLVINAATLDVYFQGHVGVAHALWSNGVGNLPLRINQWNHIGVTFNSGAMLMYMNGNQCWSSTSPSTDVDFNGSSGGYWVIGGDAVMNGFQADWRVCSGVVRSQEYFRGIFKAGYNWGK